MSDECKVDIEPAEQETSMQSTSKGASNANKWTAATELDYLFAARIIKDAKEVRNLIFKKTEKHLKSYELFLDKRVKVFIYIVLFVHLLLPIIESPSHYDVPYWLPCCIELVCLAIYFIRFLNLRSIQTQESFKKDKRNRFLLVIIILILIDVVAYLVIKSMELQFAHRYTRALRIFIYINLNEGKELRRAILNIRKTLPDIFNVFAMFFLSLLMFSFVAWNLLRNKADANKNLLIYPNNQSYFQNFEDSVWDLYVSVTTANFPDVMMPAYNLNGGYAVFFIVFMLINLYIFVNIILATIYTNYKKHLKEEVKHSLEVKRNKMNDAFNLIRVPVKNVIEAGEIAELKITPYVKDEFEYVISFSVFKKLLSSVDSKLSDNQVKVLFRIIDFDSNELLTFKEFVFLADLLNIRITERKDRQVLWEKLMPRVYNSKWSKILKNFIRHKIFHLFFNLLIVLNMIIVILQLTEKIEWFFLVIFLIEISLKMYESGFKKFASEYWNVFDTVIIFSGIIAGIVDEITGVSEADEKTTSAGLFEIVLILRSLRLIKFVASIKRFRTIITTIAIITPSLITYGMFLLTIFYIFSMIGLEIFGDVIKMQEYSEKYVYNCGNKYLADTEFTRFRYCKNNFSSFANSFVLLFELMVVNQWHILSKGFEQATGGNKFTRIYFFLFHLTCVIISLNIFTAFVIEAFLLEYENKDEMITEKITCESKLECRIMELGLNNEPENVSNDNKSRIEQLKEFWKSLRDIVDYEKTEERTTTNLDSTVNSGVRFHVNSREPKSVDTLLQRMFSKEFDITQDNLLNTQSKE